MNTRLYVDNLAATTTYNDLMDLFSTHGNVVEVNLPVDRGQYRVDLAEDGAAAWQALHANRYDLLITDNRMPKVCAFNMAHFARRVACRDCGHIC